MRIENETGWRTDHLRAFARRVADKTLEPSERKQLVIKFVDARSRGVSGYAYYGVVWYHHKACRFIKIRLPRGEMTASRKRFLTKWSVPDEQKAAMRSKWTTERTPNRRALATVLEHEMLHTLGQRHGGEHGGHTMRGHYDEQTLKAQRLTWADEMPLERAG